MVKRSYLQHASRVRVIWLMGIMGGLLLFAGIGQTLLHTRVVAADGAAAISDASSGSTKEAKPPGSAIPEKSDPPFTEADHAGAKEATNFAKSLSKAFHCAAQQALPSVVTITASSEAAAKTDEPPAQLPARKKPRTRALWAICSRGSRIYDTSFATSHILPGGKSPIWARG